MTDEREPKDAKPDWDSFETWKGGEPKEDPWWGPGLHRLMVGVVVLLIFAVAGAIAFLVPYGTRLRGMVADESMTAAGVRFVIGGALGVVAVLRLYHGKRN
jgi:hypothetical protein